MLNFHCSVFRCDPKRVVLTSLQPEVEVLTEEEGEEEDEEEDPVPCRGEISGEPDRPTGGAVPLREVQISISEVENRFTGV